jgi:hypothetical protein
MLTRTVLLETENINNGKKIHKIPIMFKFSAKVYFGTFRIANTKAVCVCAPDNNISSTGNSEKIHQKSDAHIHCQGPLRYLPYS